MYKNIIIGCVLLMVTCPLMAANSLAVTGAAALSGSYGMAVTHDGSTNRVYVQDSTPAEETTYNASFWIKKNTLYIDNCSGTCSDRHVIFLARDTVPAVTPFRVTIIRFKVDGIAGARYAIRLSAREDAGNFRFVGGFILSNTAAREVRVEWAAGAGTGYARLYKGDVLQAELTGLDNDTMTIDLVRLGATSGLTAADIETNGTVYFDDFVSTR
jgi:hypothetical protein